ncbi:hypothetical protein [Enterococcus sp. N249-2]
MSLNKLFKSMNVLTIVLITVNIFSIVLTEYYPSKSNIVIVYMLALVYMVFDMIENEKRGK